MSKEPTFVSYTMKQVQEMIARGEDKTDPNAPEGESMGPDFWKNARVVWPHERGAKMSVHMRVDNDIVAWFKSHGRGHLPRMNAVLRAYVDPQKKYA